MYRNWAIKVVKEKGIMRWFLVVVSGSADVSLLKHNTY